MLDSHATKKTWKPGAGVGAGAGAVVGWLLHDLAVFLEHGPPGVPLAFAPALAPLLLLGALLGVLAASRRGTLVCGLLLGFLSLLPLFVPLHVSRAVLWIPRASFLLLLASHGALRLGNAHRRSANSAVLRSALLGILLGILACGLKTFYRLPLGALPMGLLLGAGAALLLALVTKLRLLPWICLAGVGFPLLLAGTHSVELGALARSDLGPPAHRPADAQAPNLILIVLDTLRADRLAPYGYGRVTTPALDRFVAERMTRYTRAHSVSSWTLPAHASLLTGLLPAQHGATNLRSQQHRTSGFTLRPAVSLPAEQETLAEVLRERGYRTGAVLANCAYLDHRFGLDQGFEHYDARPAPILGRYLALPQLGDGWSRVGHVPYRSAQEIAAEARRWLSAVGSDGGPYFLLLNFMEAHEPYVTPRACRGLFGDPDPIDPLSTADPQWPVLYDRALVDLDAALSTFLGALERAGLLENTALVITSDHGQALGDHGFFGHAWALTEDQTRVPLYVLPAGGRVATEDDTPLDTTAVHALLRRLLGLPELQADRPFPGSVSELFGVPAPPAVQAWAESIGRNVEADRLAWIEGSRKWIASSDGDLRVFDLASDPGELSPLDVSPSARDDALERARSWWTAHPPRAAETGPLPADLLDRMNALGYGGK